MIEAIVATYPNARGMLVDVPASIDKARSRDDGHILIVEFVLPDVIDRADADLEKCFLSDLNMLAVTGGKERSSSEWRVLVARAGLRCNRVIPVSGDLVSVIECAPQEREVCKP